MLTFVIPVRHHETIKDWNPVYDNLAITIRSISAQKNRYWHAVIVANEGTPIPEVPEQVSIVRVDLPISTLPDRTGPIEKYYQAVRVDKGARILAGLVHARPNGHVMFVDYDDLVSSRLAGFVDENHLSYGWYFDDGYLYSGGDDLFLYDGMFYRFCGTSHIVRADLLNLPPRIEAADYALVSRWMGSHIFLKDDLDQQKKPLDRLPFPGSIYRIGHSETTSGSRSIAEFVAEQNAKDPSKIESRTRNFCKLIPELTREFFG